MPFPTLVELPPPPPDNTVGSWAASERTDLTCLGLEGRVHLIQNADDAKLACLYSQTVAFVYPSLYEGFGLPLFEAMSCGCPVIASLIQSTIEVAHDCPIYFDASDANDLARALCKLLKDGVDEYRIQRGMNLAKEYSWLRTAKKTLDVYYELFPS